MNYREAIREIKKILTANKISHEKWIEIKEEIDYIFDEQFKQTPLIPCHCDLDDSQD